MLNATRPTNQQKNVNKVADVYIYDIPTKERRELCQILEVQNVWKELAEQMGYNHNVIEKIRWSSTQDHNSEPEELLTLWGEQNHTVTELFVLLSRIHQYAAMIAIKNLVDPRLHKLILKNPSTQCAVEQNNINSAMMMVQKVESKKILNKSMVSFSNENNNENIVYGDDLNDKKPINGGTNHATMDANESAASSTIPKIDYDELRDATNNWCKTHILGKGGFGTVFKGMWKLTAVAIKRIEHRGTGTAEMKVEIQQSLNELRYLNSCRHDNILPLYGYSTNGEEPCLVYQLMTGGSLAQRLSENKTKNTLLWHQRVGIAIGTARGLQYLHTFNVKPLIHGDIKPANILLGACCQPKIGDFGLAREGDNDVTMQVSRVYGTRPYLPDEFLGRRTLSTKVDTYSFGVVLMELATGLKAYDRTNQFLTTYIQAYIKSGNNILELMDKMPPVIPEIETIFQHIISIALLCTDERHENRPEMTDVLKRLETKMTGLVEIDID